MRCLISDLDGTLFDTRQANQTAYLRAFGELGFPIDGEHYERAFGLRMPEMVRQVRPDFPAERLPELKRIKARYYSEWMDLVRPNVALLDFLQSCAGVVPIGLATTASRANAEAVLNHFGVLSLFTARVYGEDVTHPKPHPECFQLCLAQCGAAPESCLVFEDSDVGMRAAAAAGLQVIYAPAQGASHASEIG